MMELFASVDLMEMDGEIPPKHTCQGCMVPQ